MELLDISKIGVDASIVSCDNNGVINWHKITNVTRHDPSEYIYKIKTKWGRSVSVVASKSLLIWNDMLKVFEVKNSEDVQIGDKVPISFNTPNTEFTKYVDMREYLPSNKYIYGTDYNKGYNEFGINKKFPILDEHVYLRCARRTSPFLKDKFELNRDNGFFIGMYLAEGNFNKDYVGIANNDKILRDKIETWFTNNNISTQTQVKKFDPNRPGLSTSIRGYSALLGQFLDKFLGRYSAGKYIPNEAYTAPDEFVKGLIDGYISGDGCVTDYHVVVSSVSKKLITGISYLLTRYGIFTKISNVQQKKNNIGSKNIQRRYILSIQSKYVYKFGEHFTLSHVEKQEKLNGLLQRKTLDNMSFLYEENNDVILDKIISIEKIASSSDDKYKKVFDITVPETLNFAIYDGLQCRDTSETGYIQRRLVKAMEDCKVYYDQTVRNATGAIVQYVYGEDGIDGIKIENQYISYIGMNLIEMDIKYNLRPEEKLELYLTEGAIEQMKSESDWMKDSRKYYEQLIDDRQYLINNVFHGEKVEKIQYPIPFDRIIRTALQRIGQVAPTAVQTDLTPGYILDTLNKLLTKLKMLQQDQGIRFLHILLRMHLCPKVLIMEHHMTKVVFEWVVNEIETRFMKALVHPGEMVGIIAAQSIGELGTQQTLDSFHSSGTAAAVKATSGVPRLKELLSVSKNIKTPSLLICLKPDIGQVAAPTESEDGTVTDIRMQESKEKCIKVMQQLEITRMVDILDSTEIYWDPPGDRGLQTGIPDDDGMLAIYRTFANIDDNQCRSQSPWVLRMKINKDRMYRLGLTMMDIYIKLHTAYHQSIECLFSDDNASELIFRVRLTKDALKDVEPDDFVSALKAMEHNIVNNVLLKGLKGIKKVSMRSKNRQVYNPDKDAFEKVVEWMLDTDGTNLQDILANPNIDQFRTRSNDIYEIYQTLGIEAARNALYVEFMEVVGEGAINYRHMSLLLDTMTNRGSLMSVDRHGINRGDVGPLAKSSFEETTDMLINASMFSEADHINGVSANIMLGQLPPCGTGDHEILLDEDAFVELMKDKRKLGKKGTFMRFTEPVDNSTFAEKEACAIENIAFNYTLPEKNTNMKAFPKQSVTFV